MQGDGDFTAQMPRNAGVVCSGGFWSTAAGTVSFEAPFQGAAVVEVCIAPPNKPPGQGSCQHRAVRVS